MKKMVPIFINIVLYFALVAMIIVAPEYTTFNLFFFLGNLLLSLGLIFIYRHKIKSHLNKGLLVKGFSQLLNLFLIICILGLLNFLIYKNDYYVDLTKHKLNSLSKQSIQAIKKLKGEKLSIQLFSTKNSRKKYLNLLKLYQRQSNFIEIDYIDIEENLSVVQANGIKENGTILINYQNKLYRTLAKDELAVTNLLLKILSPTKKIIYYTVGHNEMSLDSKSPIGGNFLKEKIENSNYELKSLQLQYNVPKDAGLVLILNPQIEFLDSEINNLTKYLEAGGSALISLAPAFNGLMIKKVEQFLMKNGVEYKNLLVLDKLAAQQGAQASIPIVNNYADHPITKGFNDRTLFPISGHFNLMSNAAFEWNVIARSTPFPGSWGETSFQEVRDGKSSYNENIDYKGPLNLFLVGENKNSRIALFSSSSFISNQFQGQSNNFNLFLNTLDWLVREDALLSLDRPGFKGNLIYISSEQVNLVFYLAILTFPFLFFIAAIFVYNRRVNK